jgi:hypothetical protein
MIEWIEFLAWVALCVGLLPAHMSTPRSTTSQTSAGASGTGSRSRCAHGTIERYPLVRSYRSPCARYTAPRWRNHEQSLRPLSVPSDIC